MTISIKQPKYVCDTNSSIENNVTYVTYLSSSSLYRDIHETSNPLTLRAGPYSLLNSIVIPSNPQNCIVFFLLLCIIAL